MTGIKGTKWGKRNREDRDVAQRERGYLGGCYGERNQKEEKREGQ